jgi:hypothetical protein
VSFIPREPPPPAKPPKWLALAAVGVIAIAVLLIVTGLTAPLSIAFFGRHPLASLSSTAPHVANMIEWQEKMMAFPAPQVSFVVGVAGLAVGIWALTRAVGVLSRKPGVRAPFRRSIAALVAVESVSTVVSIWLQSRNTELAGELAEAMAPPGAGSPAIETMMGTLLQAGMLLGVVFSVAWGAAKIAFLAWAHRYTGTASVANHLDRAV